jgi:hypothetical protein
MFRRLRVARLVTMIEIWVDGCQPPTGTVVAAHGAAPQAFAGWLDLLRILADAIAGGPVTGGDGTRPEQARTET